MVSDLDTVRALCRVDPTGAGFLAVFVAGIVLGDGRAPFKREIERFHGALASLGEIVAFVVLGLTMNVSVLLRRTCGNGVGAGRGPRGAHPTDRGGAVPAARG